MTDLTINTTRFGEIQIDESRIVTFVSPILGFEELDKYVILDHAEDSPFKWLQSLEKEDLAFVVTNPKLFGIHYEFVISDETAAKLELTSADDALVLNIVNIPPEDPAKMTANLLGPIVIHQHTRKAMQVVLNDTNFSTKTRLISDELLSPPSSSTTLSTGGE
jgi:flagellar assembly factor FliW